MLLSFEKKVAYGNFFAVDTYIEQDWVAFMSQPY